MFHFCFMEIFNMGKTGKRAKERELMCDLYTKVNFGGGVNNIQLGLRLKS